MNVRRSDNGSSLRPLATASGFETERLILDEEAFRRMISLERKRSERSRKPFLLMLLDMGEQLPSGKNGKALGKILSALSQTTRETDVTGWYTGESVVGVMFTEITLEERETIPSIVIDRVSDTLRRNLTFNQFNKVSISFHVFPENWDDEPGQRPSNPTLYPDLTKRDKTRRVPRILKRGMDIIGSLAALMFLSPMFLAIAIAIKCTSKGPILFRQYRIGQFGEPFLFLKFRSMYVNNDASEHQAYVKKLIAGTANKQSSNGNGTGVYKLTKDSRVTSIGSFLRKTSLDELPQFIHVLQGKMSLVGPRPPLPYEVEAYDFWHRCRVLEAKPGITGLWQINGRSRVTFDEMVRLDLQYARSWSPWMDIKILLRTPGAVFLGEGAH